MNQCEMCDSTQATYVLDPFLQDVHEEHVYRWLCSQCYQTRIDDI